jgi:hypothetical protein
VRIEQTRTEQRMRQDQDTRHGTDFVTTFGPGVNIVMVKHGDSILMGRLKTPENRREI